jgi:hypothetical protein
MLRPAPTSSRRFASCTHQPPTSRFPFHPSPSQYLPSSNPSPISWPLSDPTWASTSRLCSGRDALSVLSSLPGPHKRAGQQIWSRAYLWPRWSEGPKRAPFHSPKWACSLELSSIANAQSSSHCRPTSYPPSFTAVLLSSLSSPFSPLSRSTHRTHGSPQDL